jgi:CO/xanthine dehydrogenase Mo-binding subunit
VTLEGKSVETIEGLAKDGNLHPVQEAFLLQGAVQCGFCTPGMIMASKALLEKNPSPSDEEIKKGLKNNLCRCTGYVKIIQAVRTASEWMNRRRPVKTEPTSTSLHFNFVGLSLPDVDGLLKVKGELIFADDISVAEMGYGAILWSQYPHAEILSIDTSKAGKLEGVRAVLTAKDIPGRNGFGLLMPDQPVLAEKKVRFLGDPVALVVSASEEIARKACRAISVEYRELGRNASPHESLRSGAPPIHSTDNVLRHIRHAIGDIGEAFSESALVIERDYSTPFVDHAFLEPESAVAAVSEDGKIVVWTCTQFPFEMRTQIAACLGLPEDRVRVITTPLGGAFGGKVSVTVQILAALGALRTGRPVKITLTREESLRFHTKKHASLLHYKTGFSKDGKILANQAKIILDAGPYADVSPIALDQACIFSCGPYDVPNVDIEGWAVFTNNANGGAMRGFGINQVAFAMEQQLDIACEDLKIDPFELRFINALDIGKRMVSGEILRASVPIKKTIRSAQGALASLPKVLSTKEIGVGVASGMKNVGVGKGSVDNAGAIVELTEEGHFKVYVSTVDMGQGNRTVLVQIVAHELGIGQDKIEMVTGDTDLVLKALGIAGARATYCGGNAAILAARKFKKRFLEVVSEEFNVPSEGLNFCPEGVTHGKNGGNRILTFEEIGRRLASKGKILRVEYDYNAPRTYPISYDGIPESDTVMTRYAPAEKSAIQQEDYRNYPAYVYITSVAVVEVDESTGDVQVKKVISAVDVGKAINPQKIEGQIEGSVLMGMGYALSERYELRNGVPVTDQLRKCGLLTIDQTPEIITAIIEDEDPEGPYGAKGISEVATAPVTPAIINAIHNAVGIRIYDLPATRDKILKELRLVK